MFTLHPQLQADTITVGRFRLSQMLLLNNASVPWIILVPQKAEMSEWHHLSQADQQQLHKESMLVCELLMQEFKGDKMNTASLGNAVPQLHVHHIVRFRNDPVWPLPVWGNLEANPYSDGSLKSQIVRLQQLFSSQTRLTYTESNWP